MKLEISMNCKNTTSGEKITDKAYYLTDETRSFYLDNTTSGAPQSGKRVLTPVKNHYCNDSWDAIEYAVGTFSLMVEPDMYIWNPKADAENGEEIHTLEPKEIAASIDTNGCINEVKINLTEDVLPWSSSDLTTIA